MTAPPWLIGLILVISAWVRLRGVDLGWFMVDQARDVSEALRIVNGQNFPLVGPIAQGLYALGPLYYYLIALPLWFRPEPEAAVFFLALLNLSTVYLAYRIGREFFSSTVGVVGAALYGVFPMAVLSGKALWNPGFVPVFSIAFFYALFHFLVLGKAWGLVLALVALACLLQVHLSGLALVILFCVTLLLFRPRIPRREALIGVGLVLALFSSYLLFEARRGFQMFPDALRFFQTQGQVLVRQSWVEIAWRALRAPFVIPAHMAEGFLASPPPPYVRPVQEIELALCVAGGIWLLVASLHRWRRTGSFPKAEGLLLLWIAVPLLTLTHKKQLLFWYYFDLLYPAQFLVIGLLVDTTLRAFAGTRVPPLVRRIARGVVAAGLGALVAGQVWFLGGLKREVEASGLLRLPTSVGLRSPDPFWFIKEQGYLDLMPLRYKRTIAEALLAEAPMSQSDFYRQVHGAAFENLIEDSGLFYRLLRRSEAPGGAQQTVGVQNQRQWLVLRAGQWPGGVREVHRQVGPYWLVRSAPSIRYDQWRCAHTPRAGWSERPFDDRSWPVVALPARAIPDPSVYVIPPLSAWPGMPLACRGWVDWRDGLVSLVVSLRTTPLPDHRVTLERFTLNGHRISPSRSWSSLTAMHRHVELVFDAAPFLEPGSNLVAFQVVGGSPAFDLDLYEVRRSETSR